MQDQVSKLASLGVPVLRLTGELEKEDIDFTYCALSQDKLDLKLLYVTPEMIGKSAKFHNVIRRLYERGLLARYDVRPKRKTIEDDIANLIKNAYNGKCGIIYCTSKRACEEVAKNLQKARVSAEYYHAGLEKMERRGIQEKWIKGTIKVIVATVAFGMGIDKPDVRFVIHFAFPQSLEGYYQETDKMSHDALIDNGEGSESQKERQRNNVRQVIAYCENKVECRRQQVLQYFGEKFRAENCNKSCDNCRDKESTVFYTKDITENAQNLIKLLEALPSRQKVTLILLQDMFKGAKHARIMNEDLDKVDKFGSGKDLAKSEIERICHYLISKNVLQETCERNKSGFITAYVGPGRFARDVLNGRMQMKIDFVKDDKEKTKAPPRASKPKKGAKNGHRPSDMAIEIDESDDNEGGDSGQTRAVPSKFGSTSKRTLPDQFRTEGSKKLVSLVFIC
ncbi:ATP-dependent DNA helicase sgs1 [Dinochytrium kinnereticum]|nr:ATP-dependent DNA helicase sgs1 [Dinochytrium kinnereticum]